LPAELKTWLYLQKPIGVGTAWRYGRSRCWC